MAIIEVKISDIIIQHPEINSFVELLNAVRGMTSVKMLFMEVEV